MYKKTGYFKRRRILKKANFLDLTPLPAYPHQEDENARVQIITPRFSSFIFRKLLLPTAPSPNIIIPLDEQGSVVWKLCDGKNDVRTICRKAEEQLGQKVHPAADRITRFLRQLYRSKLIVFREIIKNNKP